MQDLPPGSILVLGESLAHDHPNAASSFRLPRKGKKENLAGQWQAFQTEDARGGVFHQTSSSGNRSRKCCARGQDPLELPGPLPIEGRKNPIRSANSVDSVREIAPLPE